MIENCAGKETKWENNLRGSSRSLAYRRASHHLEEHNHNMKMRCRYAMYVDMECDTDMICAMMREIRFEFIDGAFMDEPLSQSSAPFCVQSTISCSLNTQHGVLFGPLQNNDTNAEQRRRIKTKHIS